MCRPRNTNQDYEISLQNIKDIFKNPEKAKNFQKTKVLIRMWRNQKPVYFCWGYVIHSRCETVLQFTQKLNVEY